MSPWLAVRVRLDRVLAAVALVACAPVLAVAGLLVRRDGGPAFVAVPRMGQGGRPFGMWKVRTMRADGPGGVAAGASLAAGEVDPRITAVGRRLRRWRVDELANLVNVVRGEMALLGPRPEAVDLVDLADARWRHVLLAPPAIAGPTQVLVERWEAEVLASPAGPEGYLTDVLPVKLAVDGWYVREATPAVDLSVLAGLVGWMGRGGARWLRVQVGRAVPDAAALP